MITSRSNRDPDPADRFIDSVPTEDLLKSTSAPGCAMAKLPPEALFTFSPVDVVATTSMRALFIQALGTAHENVVWVDGKPEAMLVGKLTLPSVESSTSKLLTFSIAVALQMITACFPAVNCSPPAGVMSRTGGGGVGSPPPPPGGFVVPYRICTCPAYARPAASTNGAATIRSPEPSAFMSPAATANPKSLFTGSGKPNTATSSASVAGLNGERGLVVALFNVHPPNSTLTPLPLRHYAQGYVPHPEYLLSNQQSNQHSLPRYSCLWRAQTLSSLIRVLQMQLADPPQLYQSFQAKLLAHQRTRMRRRRARPCCRLILFPDPSILH